MKNFSKLITENIEVEMGVELIQKLKKTLEVILETEKLNMTECIQDFENEFGDNLITFINLRAFFLKVKNILEFGRPNWVKFISKEFDTYIKDVDERIEFYEPDEQYSHDQNFDIEEGESSLIKSSLYWTEMQKLQDEMIKFQCWVDGGRRIMTSEAKEAYDQKIKDWKLSQSQKGGNTNPGQFTRERFLKEVDHLNKTPIFKFEPIPSGKKQRIVIVFEGRDGAGKGSTIKRFMDFLMKSIMRVVAGLPIPTPEERANWFERYEKLMPRDGEIVLFDRSWYNRAVVEPVNGYCTEEEYNTFMEKVNDWEAGLINSGVKIIKLWFSITQDKQKERFLFRQTNPYKFWKFSPNDAKVVDKYDLVTYYKIQMFNHTSTRKCPWVTINSNDKKIARLNAIKYVLSKFEYPGKIEENLNWQPEIVTVIR